MLAWRSSEAFCISSNSVIPEESFFTLSLNSFTSLAMVLQFGHGQTQGDSLDLIPTHFSWYHSAQRQHHMKSPTPDFSPLNLQLLTHAIMYFDSLTEDVSFYRYICQRLWMSVGVAPLPQRWRLSHWRCARGQQPGYHGYLWILVWLKVRPDTVTRDRTSHYCQGAVGEFPRGKPQLPLVAGVADAQSPM